MIAKTFDCGRTAAPKGGARRVHSAILGVVCVLVIGVYAWSANSGWLELRGAGAEDTYYNLLVQGFRAGQLNLKREPPPGLARLADPYNSGANYSFRMAEGYPLHDMTYYRGKFYLYFGVTPALVLFWPYAALTDHCLLHKEAVVIFCAVGFLAGVGLINALWRRYFPEVSFGVVVAGSVAFGLAAGMPLLLTRCDVYEVAISCGYALTMLALVGLWGALHDSKWRAWWLTAASLACGLAVGARPSLLPWALILLVPVAQEWGRWRQVRALLLAAAGPVLVIGLGLMLYNFLRFGNPLEFGQRYQLAGARQDTMQQFSPRYLWFNFRVGFLEPARWTVRFPFMHDGVVPPLPAGYMGVEHPFGILTSIPVVWLALAAPLAWRNRSAEARSALRWFLAAVALNFAACALIIMLHNSMQLRYEVEFAFTLVLLAAIGILSLERVLADRRTWRRVVRWGWGLLSGFSVAFNLFAGIDRQVEAHNNLGNALFRKGRLDEALAHFQTALKIQPDCAAAHHNLAWVLLQKGQVDEAIDHMQKGLQIDPKHAVAHYGLGTVLLQKGQVDEAITHFQIALAMEPNHAVAHYGLGVAFLQKGQTDEAITELREALRLKPDQVEASSKLAIALSMKEASAKQAAGPAKP